MEKYFTGGSQFQEAVMLMGLTEALSEKTEDNDSRWSQYREELGSVKLRCDTLRYVFPIAMEVFQNFHIDGFMSFDNEFCPWLLDKLEYVFPGFEKSSEESLNHLAQALIAQLEIEKRSGKV